MLKVEALKVHGLEPVSFEVAEGECLAVQGPSGSGKTLLLRAIADLDPADGEISLDSRERAALTGPEWRRRVRYAAAEPGWWAQTPGQHFTGTGPPAELLTALGLDPAMLDKPLARLSTGERQRLALVRALADSPPVLLLDEPTGALDSAAAARVERLLKGELEAGRVILLVSHDRAQAARLADRRLVIGEGKARLEAA